jgi:hypothetical protein
MPTSPITGRQRPIMLSVIRIERERDGNGWLVLRREHAWLHGDRRQALGERDRLDRAERLPWWRS